MYQDRNLVARFFTRLTPFRRMATRSDKLVRNFVCLLNLVCAYIWLASLLTDPTVVSHGFLF